MAAEFDVQYQLLNAEQRRAVDHTDGPMLVLAGAGTGKTQIIALRIAKLLQTQDLNPRNILCLTFTESGVQAMRARLVSMLGAVGYQVRVYTFHGFCNEVIAEHPEVFLEHSALQALSDLDRVTVMEELVAALPADSLLKPFGAPDFYIPDILRAIQTLKRENISADRLLELIEATEETKKNQKLLAKQRELVDLYRAYQAKLRERQQYDYEDMLLYVIQAFATNADLLADFQEQYLYLLVDEYQDTNGAQNEIVRLLGAHQEAPNVFLVGDDRQSIYRFQGAAVENIILFQQRYGKRAELVSLKENYRSQQWILDAATTMIKQNQYSLAHYIPELVTDLHAARELPTAKLEVAALSSTATEYFWVTQRITSLLAAGVAPQDIAVLFRTNSDGDAFSDACLRAGIPIQLAAGGNILTDPLIQQLVRLFRFIGLAGNDEELFSITHFKWLQLPLPVVAELAHEASRTHTWLWEYLRESKDKKIAQFVEQVLEWRSAMHNQVCTQWFSKVVEESGWLASVVKSDHHLEHLNRLQTLFQAVQTLCRANTNTTIKDVLAYLDLLQKHDLMLEETPLQTQLNAVQLMTAHRAKGLEFQHVFIIRCQDKHWGNVPDRNKLKLPDGIVQLPPELNVDVKNEDERRLFYVAMTRAKERLYLSYAMHSESGRDVLPSQFLAELPVDVLIEAADVTAIEAEPKERLQLVGKAVQISPVEDYTAFARSALVDYRMSATHLNDYLECPRLFFYQDVLRAPRAATRAVGFGVAVHNALKFASEQFNIHQALPSYEQFWEVYEQDLKRQLLSKRDYEDSLGFGQQILKQYYAEQADTLTHNQFPEKDFRPYHVEVVGVPLTGKIDHIQVLDAIQKTVHVVDYKTGNPDNKASDLAVGGNYHRQLLFYKLLCDHAKEFGYTAVSGEIHFVQPSKQKEKFVQRQYEFTDEDVTRIETEVKTVYAHIQNLDFLNPDPTELCGECTWCTLLTPTD